MAEDTAKPSSDSSGSPPPKQEAKDTPLKEAAASGEGKIHVDADWKAQARAEKERLARETERAQAGAQAAAGVAAAGAAALPAASFAALVQMLATQALIFLSDERDPQTGRSLRNLDMAKFNIDLLGVLEEKTRGNLTDEEKRGLDRYLYELRMAYVAAAS